MQGIKMMDHFVVWSLRGVRYLCLRNPADPYMLERIKDYPKGRSNSR